MSTGDSLPTDLASAHAMILAQRTALLEAQAKARNAEAEVRARELLIEQMKFTIAKLRHEQFGQSSERSAVLEQLELQLADMEEDGAQGDARAANRAPRRARARCGGAKKDHGAGVRAAQAGAPSAARASAA